MVVFMGKKSIILANEQIILIQCSNKAKISSTKTSFLIHDTKLIFFHENVWAHVNFSKLFDVC